jgi:poly-beta-hydroxybutyrate-responsive repressor
MERTNGLELAHMVGPRHIVRCRFVKGAPRNFLSPAILLLLAEEPQHGYRLSKALRGFGFGRVDRSSIYRALRDLERDGLLSCSVAAPIAGSSRRVCALTESGREMLARWIQLVTQQRDCLSQVVARHAQLGVHDRQDDGTREPRDSAHTQHAT